MIDPIQNFMKLLTFLSCSSMPMVMRKPPIQKKVSTAKYAAGARVGIPGLVRMSKLSVQFLMLDSLNHWSWPQMIQKMDRTLAPFRKRRLSLSCCLEIDTIFKRLSERLKLLRILIGLDQLLDILLTIDPTKPRRMSTENRAIVRQLLQSISGWLSEGSQKLRFRKGENVLLVAFWNSQLRLSWMRGAQMLAAKSSLHSFGAQMPMF